MNCISFPAQPPCSGAMEKAFWAIEGQNRNEQARVVRWVLPLLGTAEASASQGKMAEREKKTGERKGAPFREVSRLVKTRSWSIQIRHW